MDKIEIKNLEIFANHGVFPEENVLGQKFVISATLYTDTRKAGLTDELTASIHYGEVSHMITKFTKEHTYKLLETLAENLCQMLLQELPLLKMITLRVEKPWAPVGLPLETVAVEITRGWHTAYVAFGSNLGDKKKFLDDELKILNESKQANALEILKVKREEFELEINHKMEMGKNRRMLELAYENMVNSLRTWENKYLIKSRHDGIVVWGKSWGMSHRVNEGDTVCTVISKQQANPLGHIRLSQDEVAEVAVGDKVNIELNKYPTHSYGVLPGKIASISFVPYNKSYAVEVAFPEGLTTTNHKEIKYEIDLSGKAEIITSSRSILSRIFAPIYELFKEK